MTDDTRDRVIRLEAEMAAMDKMLQDMSAKVSAMHDVMMQAKGARWLLLGTAALLGWAASFLENAFHIWPSK